MPQTKDVEAARRVAATLKRVRAERDLTQKEAAEMLGIAERTYESWEYERRAPRASGRVLIAHTFEVPYEDVGLPGDWDGSQSEMSELRSEIAGLREQLERVLGDELEEAATAPSTEDQKLETDLREALAEFDREQPEKLSEAERAELARRHRELVEQLEHNN